MRRVAPVVCALLLLAAFANFAPMIETSASPKPLAGLVVLLDAGHGGDDGGARGRVLKLWEKEINLSVALKARALLEDMGCRVLMTREYDMHHDANKRRDLDARLAIAREGGARLLVSVHMNEYHASGESGPQVFYRAASADSQHFARVMQASLIDALSPRKKRVPLAGDYYMLSLDIPSILVECGFLSNREEEAMLADDNYRALVASAIAQGVAQYAQMQDEN